MAEEQGRWERRRRRVGVPGRGISVSGARDVPYIRSSVEGLLTLPATLAHPSGFHLHWPHASRILKPCDSFQSAAPNAATRRRGVGRTHRTVWSIDCALVSAVSHRFAFCCRLHAGSFCLSRRRDRNLPTDARDRFFSGVAVDDYTSQGARPSPQSQRQSRSRRRLNGAGTTAAGDRPRCLF